MIETGVISFLVGFISGMVLLAKGNAHVTRNLEKERDDYMRKYHSELRENALNACENLRDLK